MTICMTSYDLNTTWPELVQPEIPIFPHEGNDPDTRPKAELLSASLDSTARALSTEDVALGTCPMKRLTGAQPHTTY